MRRCVKLEETVDTMAWGLQCGVDGVDGGDDGGDGQINDVVIT